MWWQSDLNLSPSSAEIESFHFILSQDEFETLFQMETILNNINYAALATTWCSTQSFFIYFNWSVLGWFLVSLKSHQPPISSALYIVRNLILFDVHHCSSMPYDHCIEGRRSPKITCLSTTLLPQKHICARQMEILNDSFLCCNCKLLLEEVLMSLHLFVSAWQTL